MSEFGAPNFRRVGTAAIALESAHSSGATQRRLWVLAGIARKWPHVREAVVGAGNLTLLFDPGGGSYDALQDQLARAWMHASDDATSARVIDIPVHYDGEDLQAVADVCALRAQEVVALHAGGSYVVSFVGFLPGFGYLDGLDPKLHVPRRTQPRTRVPAGSVAIAGAQSGVYPFESPGGWHIIGHTELHMFDPDRDPAALLQPGDAVRFVAL